MGSKLRVGLLFGGPSSEHEISCQSAWSILQHIDYDRYDVVPIAIDKKGAWHILLMSALKPLLSDPQPVLKTITDSSSIEEKWIDPTAQHGNALFSPALIKERLDVAFIMIHGFPGEDGSLAGLFSYLRLPVVGCGTMASSIGMDKVMAKKIVEPYGIKVARYVELKQGEERAKEKEIAQLGLPVFIKPASSGSSIGISKVYDISNLQDSLNGAFKESSTLLIESMVEGREIEVAVIENPEPIAAPVGEVMVESDFYSYNAKYDKASPCWTRLPKDIEPKVYRDIQQTALKIFKLLGCQGMARVDFFLNKDNVLIFNEINTLPGFTSISLFPTMVKAMGISMKELISILIENSLKSQDKRSFLISCT